MRDSWVVRALILVIAAILLSVGLLASCERDQDAAQVQEARLQAPSSPIPLPSTTPTASAGSVGLANLGATSASNPPPQVYRVAQGDTLSGIAARFGCDLDDLIEANQIANPNLLRVGQKLQLPACQIEISPASQLLPDSEFVNSPAYVGFDVGAFCAAQGGYLASYRENVGGQVLTGPEIVSLVVQRYSVGPRLLLALLELKSGWVTDPNPVEEAFDFPMGYKGGGWQLLYWQLAWAANELNRGYYDWRGRGMTPIVWKDGTVTRYSHTLNAATAGLQYFLSLRTSRPQWEERTGEGPGSFLAVYRQLFGDPTQYAIEPLIPASATQPPLTLPWPHGELWYYTSGPHGAWEEGSAWAALDFAPDEQGLGCRIASSWATAAASGLVIHSQNGEMMIDLDGDGHQETGWVLFYLHVAEKERAPAGTWVEQGDPIGHPSCEGGISEATHLHIARKYNGEWIAADGPLPFILSGWEFHSLGVSYDGTATRGGEERTACECWNAEYNGLVADR